MIRALTHAIQVINSGSHSPQKAHERVKTMYAWSTVADKTEAVYDAAMAEPLRSEYEILRNLLALGPVFGPIRCCIVAVQWMFFLLVRILRPEDEIELVEGVWDMADFDKLCARERGSWEESAESGQKSRSVERTLLEDEKAVEAVEAVV